MATPLLTTKLYVPPVRPERVSRPRLIERLNTGLRAACKLTLVSAPAGFGKTTLVTEWLSGAERPFTWLSLDESDNDPTRFLTYFVAALQRVDPNIGQTAQTMLQTPQPPSLELLLTSLINDIAAMPDPFVLVLDDYHLIQALPIHRQLAFLLEHQPPQMRLVIITREDPLLPLARLRARGQITKVRQSDLKFTQDEATNFLRQVMQLDLGPEDVATLQQRTEGWIAGLQLAALSMQRSEDVRQFVAEFAGSHRYILDYLVEEVFQQQALGVQDFLLKTSILDRLTAPCATPSPSATTAATSCWRWIRLISSSCAWTRRGSGIAITASFATCCARSGKIWIWQRCTGGLRAGSSRMDTCTRPWSMSWRRRIGTRRSASWSRRPRKPSTTASLSP